MAKLSTFIFVLVAFAVGISAGLFLGVGDSVAEIRNVSIINESSNIPVQEPFGTSISAPAIDNNGQGVTTQIFVDVSNGTGQALVDVNQIFFWVDTQFSIRTAKHVAEQYTGADLRDKDLKFGIRTQAEIVEGPSAGAAIAIATIAAIENKTLPKNVMITGTIEPDGTIGPVGGILEKAKAAKGSGATLFLVPSGQSIITRHVPNTTCRSIGEFRYCNTKFIEETIHVEKDAEIDIEEVLNIDEAAPHFNL